MKETPREEAANSISHGLGAALSIAALAVLVTLAAKNGDAWRVVSFSIYGATLVTLYLASTFYHSLGLISPRAKRFFQVVDHAAIYLLIAGTYTPFTLVNLRGGWGWSIFGVIWGLAVLGIVLRCAFKGRYPFMFVAIYIAMGWTVLVALKPTLEILPMGAVLLLVLGGLAYTFGVIFFAWQRLPYNHAVWHVFVMMGSVLHFFAIVLYVLPM